MKYLVILNAIKVNIELITTFYINSFFDHSGD